MIRIKINIDPNYKNYYNERYIEFVKGLMAKCDVLFDWIDDYDENINFDIALSILSPMHNSVNSQMSVIDLPKSKFLIVYISEIRNQHNDISLDINMFRIFERANIILCPYKQAFIKKFPEFQKKFYFFPHYFAPMERFQKLKFQNNPICQCLLTGARHPKIYPFREFIYQLSLTNSNIIYVKHPGYDNNNGIIKEHYAKLLNSYLCSIATPSVYNYLLAKYFEIPVAGALLLCKKIPELELCGFVEGIHYIAIDEKNCESVIMDVIENSQHYNEIRRNGMNLVRLKHGVQNRIDMFFEILNKFLIITLVNIYYIFYGG